MVKSLKMQVASSRLQDEDQGWKVAGRIKQFVVSGFWFLVLSVRLAFNFAQHKSPELWPVQFSNDSTKRASNYKQQTINYKLNLLKLERKIF